MFVEKVAGAYRWGYVKVQRVRWARLLGFIAQPATVWQTLNHIVESSTAPAIATWRPLSQRMGLAPVVGAPDTEFEAVPELGFDQTEDLDGEATHDLLKYAADLGAEPITDLEFRLTMGW